MMILTLFATFLLSVFRRLLKWFLRKTTRLCELQRIVYGEIPGAPRCFAIENSLDQSRNRKIQDSFRNWKSFLRNSKGLDLKTEGNLTNDLISLILIEKNIKRKIHHPFVISIQSCLNQISGYVCLLETVEDLRSTPYDSSSLSHEQELLSLWNTLKPNENLHQRISKQWQEIGFQGSDPKTDFRGMGCLGLANLTYFSHQYPSVARHILSHSTHPLYGYSFAIVGINLTQMAYNLLLDGSLKAHMYNLNLRPSLSHFHSFYIYLFIEFDKFWLSQKPRDIMEFSRIKDLFENNIRSLCLNSKCLFKINVVVDSV